MSTRRTMAPILAAICLLAAGSAAGQDFHVSTTVHDLSRPEPREMTRTLTLFHAGKTYDFIQDVGELIVFDPAHDRFTLVSTRQRRAAVVHVDEIKRKIQVARQTLAEHLDELKSSDRPGSQAMAERLLFQIDPVFAEKVSQNNGETRLDLESQHFQYHVQCAVAPSSEHCEAYLRYADWICRLNYVLHPSAILPEQRIFLNAAMRKSHLIPVEVTLAGDIGAPLRLRAQHRLYWELNDKDRELLRQWDALLSAKELKKVSFEEYQRALLLSYNSRRR